VGERAGGFVGRLCFIAAVVAVATAVVMPFSGAGTPANASASAPSERALAEIPPQMLDLYRSGADWAATALHCPLRWNLLAAIGKTETDHAFDRSASGGWVAKSRVEMTSSAGAVGPMQFLPSSWASRSGGGASERVAVAPGTAVADAAGWDGHGMDAPVSADGVADVWDPADSVFGAAHYLCGNGLAGGDERAAVFAYNHSSSYVSLVLSRAEAYADAAGSAPAPTQRSAGRITCPVGGPVSFSSSFGAPRSGGRTHQGNDLMAERGTPTVAAESGVVEKASDVDVGLGGITVWVKGDSGASYYYAHHLRNLVTVGAHVAAGDAVGLVGNTGNAASTPSHLHFEIHPLGRGTPAADPYDILTDSCKGVRR